MVTNEDCKTQVDKNDVCQYLPRISIEDIEHYLRNKSHRYRQWYGSEYIFPNMGK
jgi:hypothetical protein